MKKNFLFFIYLCAIGYLNPVRGGEIQIAGEFLYLQTCVDNPYFANQPSAFTYFDLAIPEGTRYRDQEKWHPGYRITGNYLFCNGIATEARWMQYWNKSHRFLEGVIPTYSLVTGVFEAGPFTTGEIHSRFNCQDLDFVLKGMIYDCNWSTCWVIGGARYARLHRHGELNYVDGVGDVFKNNTSSRMWGIGPEIGLEFSTFFCNCLSFDCNLRAALLATHLHSKFDGVEITFLGPENFIEMNNIPLWRSVPTIDFQLGCTISLPLLPCHCQLQAGYTFITYMRALSDVVSYADDNGSAGLSTDVYYSILLHGPYVQLSINF